MRIYHGTQYHQSIAENGFDIKKSYEQRNEKLGAGQAVYFSYDYEIASDYSTANANESFHSCVIDELEESDMVGGYLLRQLYENGTEIAWEALENQYSEQGGWGFIRNYYNDKDYDLNDVQAIAEYIRGSKVLEENYQDDTLGVLMGGGSSTMPYPIKEDARKMGIKTIPSDYGHVIVSRLKKDIKIKKIGYTKNAHQEAIKAKKQGYHAIEFKNEYSIEGVVELAIFDTAKIEILNLIEDINPWEEIKFKSVEIIIQAIENGKTNLEEIQEEIFHPGILRNNKKESQENLKNILGNMFAIKLIKYENGVITPMATINDLENKLKKSKSELANNLVNQINERKFKEAVKKRNNNSFNQPK